MSKRKYTSGPVHTAPGGGGVRVSDQAAAARMRLLDRQIAEREAKEGVTEPPPAPATAKEPWQQPRVGPMPDLNWNEIFHSAYQWPELRLVGWKEMKLILKGRDFEQQGLDIRKILRGFAEKGKPYFLSDDLVATICKLSVEVSPDILAEALCSARMPFPFTIFSWDPEARRRGYDTLGVESSTPAAQDYPAVGVLTPDDNPIKTFVDYSYIPSVKKMNIYPVVYGAAPEPGYDLRTQLGDPYLEDMKIDGLQQSLFAHWWLTSKIVESWPSAAEAVVADRRLAARRYGPMRFKMALMTKGKEHSQYAQHLLVTATAGNPRWMGALCLLLNTPKVVSYSDTYQAPEALGVKRKPAATSSEPVKLSIFLPKEQVIRRVLSNLARIERKKVGEHDVEAHWCYSHKRGDPDCAHDWPKDGMRRQLCTKGCGNLRWRKDSSKRGSGPVLRPRKRVLDYSGQPLPSSAPPDRT